MVILKKQNGIASQKNLKFKKDLRKNKFFEFKKLRKLKNPQNIV